MASFYLVSLALGVLIVSRWGVPAHFLFLALVVLNLVGGFQALGPLPSGPAIVLSAGALLLVAVLAGLRGILRAMRGGQAAVREVEGTYEPGMKLSAL